MQNPSNGQEQMSNLTFAGQSGLLTSSTVNENDRRNPGANRSGASHTTASVAGIKRCAEEDAGLKWECEDSSEDDEPKKLPPPNGKKTKGRVKIKMEFIDNKLRRYTTFSKRKTGIMKKAYELSTLTGTQVMLLVASETGHVYTFATRKLQPMITSEAGKALIQTCLNSPDPPLTNGGHPHMHIDQRMSATGFEETDLSYAVNEDDNSKMLDSFFAYQGQDNKQGVFTVAGVTGSLTPTDATQASNSTSSTQSTPATATVSIATLLNHPTVNSSTGTSKNPNLSMQLPTSGFATLFTPGLAPNTTTNNQSGGNSDSTQGHGTVTMVPNSQGNVTTAMVSGNMVLPSPAIVTSSNSTLTGTVMYQTAQGVVYAPTGALPEGLIFNIQQSPTSLSLGQEQGNTHQQYITIPVSLASATQLMQPVFTQANTNTTETSITATDLSTNGNNHLSCSSKTRK